MKQQVGTKANIQKCSGKDGQGQGKSATLAAKPAISGENLHEAATQGFLGAWKQLKTTFNC